MAVDGQAFCAGLIEALDRFDQKVEGLGLYACEDLVPAGQPPKRMQEWHLCIKPYLQGLGCSVTGSRVLDGLFYFHLPDGVPGTLQVLRTSKVKVCRFGSAYRVDVYRNYPERWGRLKADSHVCKLWKPPTDRDPRDARAPGNDEDDGLRLLLFIGFDRARDPFRAELAGLPDWRKHNVDYLDRVWEDRYGRQFNVKVCAWSKVLSLPNEEPTITLPTA